MSRMGKCITQERGERRDERIPTFLSCILCLIIHFFSQESQESGKIRLRKSKPAKVETIKNMYLCCRRYRNKEVEEHHYAPRDKFGRDAEGSSGPLIIEHDHGFRPRRNPSRERFDAHRDHGSAVGRTRSFHPAERYRMSGDRSDLREDESGRRGDGGTSSFPEASRNPVQQGRKSTMMHSKHKGKTGFHARAQGGRVGPPSSQALESSRGFPDLPQQEQRAECQPFIEENYKNPSSTKAVRHEETRSKPWTGHRARSLEGPPPDVDLDPKMPRQRMTEWNHPKPKSMTVIAEETLTIKVDMNQPVSKNR